VTAISHVKVYEPDGKPGGWSAIEIKVKG